VNLLWQFFRLSSPLYGLIAAGYLVARLPGWRHEWTHRITAFVFAVPLPAMLFYLMSHRASLPPVDGRVLIAYFGSCLIVFVIGRIIGAWLFRLDGTAQSVFGLGGIYSNIVLTGLAIAKLTLGAAVVPVVALLLVFNALILWTLVSVSVEWSRHGAFTPAGFVHTALSVLKNPFILAILGGTAFGRLGLSLPPMADAALGAVGSVAGPTAMITLGMGLATFSLNQEWGSGLAVCALKLVIQPLVVWLLAIALGLPALELRAVVLVASMAVGVNVYLMSLQFQALERTMASSVVLSNILAAFTTPVFLTALHSVN
jgi:malonate transporter and related proteins